MRWIAGGISAWLAAVLPLLGVNIAGYASVFNPETAVIAGAVALFGGILLGGVVAGLIAGRPTAKRPGGATAALPAGAIAAVLYVISVLAVIMVAIQTQAAPAVVADHPLRISGAVVFLGAILLGTALIVGMLAGKRATQVTPQAQSQAPHPAQQPTPGNYPGIQHPNTERRGSYLRSDSRDDYHDQRTNSTHSGQRDYDRRGRGNSSYDERQPARYPSGPTSRSGGDNSGSRRDDYWRDDRR